MLVLDLPPIPVEIDIERMEQALNSELFELPNGLTPEEIVQHILATARKDQKHDFLNQSN